MSKKPVIVEAVAVAAGRGTGNEKSDYSRRLEAFMAMVVQKCYDEGVANKPDVIRKRIAEARELFKSKEV